MSADNLFYIINLFFLPVITMYIYLKRCSKKLMFSFENLCIYAALVPVNSVVNKAAVVIIKAVTGKTFELHSSYYTLIGIITGVLIAFVFEIATKYISIRIEEKKNEQE